MRSSEPTIKRDRRYETLQQWIVSIGDNPIRYYGTEAEAEAFVDGLTYAESQSKDTLGL